MTVYGRKAYGGSGVHLGQGWILTCRHMAEQVGHTASCTFPSGRTYGGSVTAICGYSDLAAIQSQAADGEPAVQLATGIPAVGTEVWNAGYPAATGARLRIGRGRVARGTMADFGRCNQCDFHVSSGDSGSPLFLADGRLVGVVFAYPGTGDSGLAMACGYTDVRRFVEEVCFRRQSPSPAPSPPTPPPPPTPVVPPMPPAPPSPDLSPQIAALQQQIAQLQAAVAAIPAGPPGKDGKDGLPGPAGKDGRHGVDGKDGLPGKDGPPGKDGLPGRDGKDGAQGPPGVAAPDLSSEVARLRADVDQLRKMLAGIQGDLVVPLPNK